ncbi:MAG: hypothetical protein KGH71_05790 [Candidatus Micrarchaeota archaeon]|nr:hypothetical protein [Candidatus Micrarchaeota archaeon]
MQIKRDIKRLKAAVGALDKKVMKMSHPIIIERVDEESLSPAQQKRIKKIRSDIKKGKLDKYLTIPQLKAKYNL